MTQLLTIFIFYRYKWTKMWEDVRDVRRVRAEDSRQVPDEGRGRELARALSGVQRVRRAAQPLVLLAGQQALLQAWLRQVSLHLL